MDAVLAGLSFNTSSDHATDCYLEAYILLNAINGFNKNITAAFNPNLTNNKQAWVYFESVLLYMARVTANEGANSWGNCSVTAVDVTHTLFWHIAQWNEANPIQFFESLGFSITSKAVDIRSAGLYYSWYEKSGNLPGQISSVIRLVWRVIWFQNLYYGKNQVLQQDQAVSPDALPFFLKTAPAPLPREE